MAELSRLHKEFVDFLKKSGKSEFTITAYENDIRQMLTYFKERNKNNIEELKLSDLQEYVEYLKNERKFNLKTISRKINSIRTFFKFAVKEGYIADETNPAFRLTHPKVQQNLPRILSPLEYRALRDVSRSNQRLYTMVEVLLQTGLRIGELQRLRVSDIRKTQSGKPYLYIREFGSHPSRNVPLNATAYRALMEYLKVRPKPVEGVDNIFLTKTGNAMPVRNMRTAIKAAFKKAGIKNVTVNDIRNTFIAHHLANGVSLLTVAKLVGHKRISTTEKYLEVIKTKEDEEKLKEL